MAAYIVMTASAPTNSSWKWHHQRKRVAVVECAPGMTPRQIHPRHKAVVRIVRTWECLFVGTSTRCQYERAMREATALADELNDALMCAARRAHEQMHPEAP